MENRYPALFYENYFALAFRSPSDVLKIATMLEPLLPRYQAWKREKLTDKRRRYAFVISLMASTILLLRIWPGFQWWVIAHLRILITMFYWHGVRVSSNDCLVPSPRAIVGVVKGGANEAPDVGNDCWMCESIKDVRRLNFSDTKMIAHFATWTSPLVINVDDGSLRFVPDVMREISKAYQSRPTAEPCYFSSNVPYSFDEFLMHGDFGAQPWFAHWQNCDHEITKALRSLYPRPEFLPRSLSTMGASWIFLSSNYEINAFREVDVAEPWFWMTQIIGRGRMQLKPRPKCQSSCQSIEFWIDSSVVALVPTSGWSVQYSPGPDNDNIAYGVESYQQKWQ